MRCQTAKILHRYRMRLLLSTEETQVPILAAKKLDHAKKMEGLEDI